MATRDLLSNLRRQPDLSLARKRYAALAAGYDATCHRIEPLRALAIDRLALRPGAFMHGEGAGRFAEDCQHGESP